MKQAILLLTNRTDNFAISKVIEIMQVEDEKTDFFLLYHSKDGTVPKELCFVKRLFVFTSDILYNMGYQPISDSVVLGNCHFPFIKCYLENQGYDFYWILEDDVTFSGPWKYLFDKYEEDQTDFLTSQVRTYEDDKDWYWWSTLCVPDDFNLKKLLASFNPICRISNRALALIDKRLKEGWYGHTEVIISTILNHMGLLIKDISEEGRFCNPKETGVCNKMTNDCVALAIQEIKPYMIYHPIKGKISNKPLKKYCVISAAGRDSCHKEWTSGKNDRNFDLHLIVYDLSFGLFYNEADFLSYKRGYKLKLVYDYLVSYPEYLEHYDYFFMPDDDIRCNANDIERLFACMKEENLKIAQPALTNSYFTYLHTLRHPKSKIRFTNFVEMMTPCLSRDALKKVLISFNSSERGWGIEYHWEELIHGNHIDMAIIDTVGVQHSRPFQSWSTENQRDADIYIEKYHLSTDIREYSCIPQDMTIEVFQSYKKKREVVFHDLMSSVEELIALSNKGFVSQPGIYGKCGLGIILWLFADEFEFKDYKDNARKLLKQIDWDSVMEIKEIDEMYKEDLGTLLATFRKRVDQEEQAAKLKNEDIYKGKMKSLVNLLDKCSNEFVLNHVSELNHLYAGSWKLLNKCFKL